MVNVTKRQIGGTDIDNHVWVGRSANGSLQGVITTGSSELAVNIGDSYGFRREDK